MAPVISTTGLGALSLPLTLLIALAWRRRAHPPTSGTALGAAIALKLFLWPLLIWLIATRRFQTVVATVATAGILIVLPWAALGFAGMATYPYMLHMLSSIEAPESYTIAAIAAKAGFSWRLSELGTYVVGLSLFTVALIVGNRRYDKRAFSVTLIAALVLSPIVWNHYFALLLIPVAIESPTLGLA